MVISSDDNISSFFDDISSERENTVIDEEINFSGLDTIDKNDTAGKRSSKDFNPDMDALLISAQSPMITEALELFLNKDFSSNTIEIYKEALRGISLFIKIIDRNPINYKKLQPSISLDPDCLKVENTAFDLFKKRNNRLPNDNNEKITAYTMLQSLIKNALSRAMLYHDIDTLRQFLSLHGTVKPETISHALAANRPDLLKKAKSIEDSIMIATNIMQKKSYLQQDDSRDKVRISSFLIAGTSFLYHLYSIDGNLDAAKKYLRMHETHKRYLIVRE